MTSVTAAPSPTLQDVTSYWNRRPCNIRHSTKEVGTREYFDEVEQRKYFVEPHIPGFAQFERWRGKRVLEVGCGIGTDAVNFARAGADYWAIDVSDASLALARRRFEVFDLRGNLQAYDAEKLADVVPAQSFDLVYSFGVIHHTPHPDAVISDIRKVIKPDGELRIMLYAKNSWKSVMIEGGFDQPEAQSGCPIAFTYTADEVRDLLRQNSFEVVKTSQDHIFPYIVEKYVRYEYEPHPWFKAMPEDMFRHLERAMGWHLLVVARPV
jgi:ubiquinone/menaquinone biosynthesis C-methylase UbiE